MEGTITVRLVEDLRQKTPRQMCFALRKRLDSSPRVFKIYKILLGAYVVTHLFAAFLIFTVRHTQIGTGAEAVEWSLYPLLFLALQSQVLCISMIGVIVSDIKNHALNLAVWQRSAIGRIIRNTFVSLMIFLFFFLCILYSETADNTIVFVSVSKIGVPLIILLVLSIIKLMLIKTDSSAIWLTISFCVFAELIILIIVNDFQVHLMNAFVFLPLFGVCAALGVKFVKDLKVEVMKALGGISACVSFGIYLSLVAGVMDGFIEPQIFYCLPAFIGFFLTYWYFSQSIGVFVLDIVFGHVETDYYYFINPPVKDGIRSCTT